MICTGGGRFAAKAQRRAPEMNDARDKPFGNLFRARTNRSRASGLPLRRTLGGLTGTYLRYRPKRLNK
jgi:hypothetical protein